MVNSSAMPTPRGLRACGLWAITTSSGTTTVRDQYEILEMWTGDHDGRLRISTGITGTPRQGIWPNRASRMRVNTLQRAAPPWASTASRARFMCGASIGSPTALRAK